MGLTLWAPLPSDQSNTDHEDLYFQWLQQEEGGTVSHCGKFMHDGHLSQEGRDSLEENGGKNPWNSVVPQRITSPSELEE